MSSIAIAMSGGVDSTVAAYLLMKEYEHAEGLTMRVYERGAAIPDGDTESADDNCTDARAVCDSFGIRHNIISLGESFERLVIDRFVSEYINGRTPNPCVECNREIKFGRLFSHARSLGLEHLGTGHYARLVAVGDSLELRMARDTGKDQSYFLWSISKQVLPFLRFPLGEHTKTEVRELAAAQSFLSARRSDSQDICFIENGDYAAFIKERTDKGTDAGEFKSPDGKTLGRHSGLIHYTVGQRKGLGVSFGVPMFVGAKNATDNTVTLCTDAELYGDTLTAHSVNLLVNDTLDSPRRLTAKIRYRHTPAAATAQMTDLDTLHVKFDLPQRAISSGQSVVLYDGDTVVGGGIIN